VSVKDIMDATRLAENVVEELEKTGLFSNPMFNRVYLRSIFRSYAGVVGLDEENVLAALEEALDGRYAGSLRQDDAGEAPLDDSASPAEEAAPETGEVDTQETAPATAPVPPVSAIPDEAQSSGRVVLLPNMRGMWAAGIAALVLLALIVVALTWVLTRDDAVETGNETGATVPSTESLEQAAPVDRPGIMLPDTLQIGVKAVTEPLDPIRITLDLEQEFLVVTATDTVVLPVQPSVRFPLWVEMDSTVAFRFLETARFEREVENALFTVEGYELPADWTDEAGIYTVNRDSVLALIRRTSDAP